VESERSGQTETLLCVLLIARNESAATRKAGSIVAVSGVAATLGATVAAGRDVHAIATSAIPATNVDLCMK
jgi:hypothetical protein